MGAGLPLRPDPLARPPHPSARLGAEAVSDTQKRIIVRWIAGVMFVITVAYVGAYYTMLEPSGGVPWFIAILEGRPKDYKDPTQWGAFFAPMIWIDKKIRPRTWDPGWPSYNRKPLPLP